MLTREAQRAAGAIPTAEPFTRTTRTAMPAPPLRLGIACDVSGSMHPFTAHVASAAWILAHAAHHTHVPADTATVIFGHHVHPVVHPGKAPATVTEFAARDNFEAIDDAIDALDGALGLSRPEAARLLVIVSDGRYRAEPRKQGQRRIDRLRATRCAVLWLTPDTPSSDPLDGTTVHVMTDPAAA
ncbi:VWA domain-containing protein, partial [Phytoactinopolyspora endophytica]|uniref:VWA domain-containing protein n=1 Tax=Phytoactinopolyspora endophytica TaxID=1642495 RepID=UPI00197B7FAC